MGIYSTNRYGSVSDFDVVAAEGYNGEIGAAIAMIEGYQNDMALFNGVIATDFQEAAMIHEGASEAEVYVLQEGALKGAWEKLKEFFKKLIEKIKGIFHAFIVKMESVFMKDSKEFYKKHIAEINKKKTWEGFKCKVKMLKVKGAVLPVSDILKGDLAIDIDINGIDYAELLKKWDDENEFKDGASAICTKSINASNSKEFEEEYMNTIFNDEETKDDWTLGEITGDTVGEILQNNKGLSDLNKANIALEKKIKKIIDNINKAQNDLDKVSRDGKTDYTGTQSFSSTGDTTKSATSVKSTEVELTKWQKAYEYANKSANIAQSVIMAYTSSSVKAYKEAAAQARRVFAAAVAFAPKNEAVYAAAVGDAAYYEACDLMDTMYDM